MERILKMYWKCDWCGNKDIDGLVDVCPSCGKQKAADVKYYPIEGRKEYVSGEELHAAGIAKEECDGNHKEWVCIYCQQLNNWADTSCKACGATKAEAKKEYGGVEIKRADFDEPIETDESTEELPEDEGVNSNTSLSEEYADKSESKSTLSEADHPYPYKTLKGIGIGFAVLAFIWLIAFLFWPHTKTVTVTGFSWNRNITVEEERTVKEDGWSVPSGGRVYDEKWEFKEYVTVVDHYETVTETKSRQVIDHYETVYSYRDNGNGTMSEISHQEPVYKTEYYTETHQEPVYRQDAVYDTKYYYEIERWFDVKDYESSGYDQSPYWNEDYVLESNERDTKRSEKYYVYYDDESSDRLDYEEWLSTNIGDGFLVTYNRLGITYTESKVQSSEEK